MAGRPAAAWSMLASSRCGFFFYREFAGVLRLCSSAGGVHDALAGWKSPSLLVFSLVTGSYEETQAELERVQGILRRLVTLDSQPPPPRTEPGGDYAYNLLLELQQRRRTALRFEISRLRRALSSSGEPIKNEL